VDAAVRFPYNLVSRKEGSMSARTYERFVKLRGLTAQDMEVVRGVVSGLTNKKIADHLQTDEKAVSRILGNVFAKVGVSSRTELALVFVNLVPDAVLSEWVSPSTELALSLS